MSQIFLLDTNVISELLRPVRDPHVTSKFETHSSAIVTCSIVWNELLFGCYRLPGSRKRDAIEVFLFEIVYPTIPILDYDERAAVWHARERARLESLGLISPFADGQIAATAKVNDCVLVTRNTTDYDSFEGLKLSDWSIP